MVCGFVPIGAGRGLDLRRAALEDVSVQRDELCLGEKMGWD